MKRLALHLVLCLLLSAQLCNWANAQTTCTPSALGQPCAFGGIAIQARAEPEINLGAGNPIHLITGNKYQHETDLPAFIKTSQLEIARHYNALDRRLSTFGQGWALGYDTRLFAIGDRWQIVQADGSRITFTGLHGQPAANRHGTLIQNGDHWTWTWPTGQTLRFNQQGLLVRITLGPPTARNTIDITRASQTGPLFGTISKITHSQGKSLKFNYQTHQQHAYVQSINSPQGLFRYQYEPAADHASLADASTPLRLRAVIRPDGMQRRYLYEAAYQAGNPFHLTGIEIVSTNQLQQERIATWAYDRTGRAILSIKGDPDSPKDKIALMYVKSPNSRSAGLTTVTNAEGKATHFHTAIRGGRHVLLRVTGQPCAGCAAPGTHAEYDGHGRLSTINGTSLTRHHTGHIKQLIASRAGWTKLVLRYQDNGLRTSWQSTLTGTEYTLYNTRNLPIRRAFANGDQWDYDYDAAGRPIQITAKNIHNTHTTTLQWQGRLLTHINHPNENEARQYDEKKRLRQRSVTRTQQARPDEAIRYTERFEYDKQNRLIKHHLPEGGTLEYQWGQGRQLLHVNWRNARAAPHTVIHTAENHPGYHYGNGLQLVTLMKHGQASHLVLHNQQAAIWTQHLHYDKHGLLQQESHQTFSTQHAETWRYAHNSNQQLIGAQAVDAKNPLKTWYAWQRDGSLAAQQTNNHNNKPVIQRDQSGLPIAFNDYVLSYGPNRRLSVVQRNDHIVDVYQHNAFGQRISKQTPRSRTHYFYLNNQVVAESRQAHSSITAENGQANITRRYIYAHHALVGLIDYSENTLGTLYAVHTDLAGAPRLVTDALQQIRWHASYSPTGVATQLAGDLRLDIRLPGQLFDQSTGWHDNLLRTYLPQLGHYLEPDPLGPVPGNQALGYADQQPKRYIDPLGLMLFAFDGTNNAPETQTNVWKMSQRYQDGPIFYHSGPGSPQEINWDSVTAYSATQIIETQWQLLLDTLESATVNPNDVIPIDIIGFSRGAALARHFGNVINRHVDHGLFSYSDSSRGLINACVDLRFMGLFDTVAQFGLGGSQNSNYDLSIASAWEWVAHAVALQEHRWAFPLSSAATGASPNLNTIEAPFIGAHADIGGGLAYMELGIERSDLSDVALNWMLWQARAASLQFTDGEPSQHEITSPILHDLRSTLARSIQNGDRRIDAADGSLQHNYQNMHSRLGKKQREATELLIQRYDNWRHSDAITVGSVDMNGYAQWLQDELGWQAQPI